MEDLTLNVDDGGRFKCDNCNVIFEVYGMDADEVEHCPVCGSGKVWIIEEMMIWKEVRLWQNKKIQWRQPLNKKILTTLILTHYSISRNH